jgi:hypothetical protein
MTDPGRIIETTGQALTLIERIAAFFGDRPVRRRSAAERAAGLRSRASAKRISAARARFPGARARRLKAAAALDAEADMLDPRPR